MSKITVVNQNNQLNTVEKLLYDLEELCKKLTETYAQEEQTPITNESIELQKFCFKFEYLLQYKLKAKKNLLSSNTKKDDYWQLILNVLVNNRCFDDAIKYVKNVSEIKTNLGRGRAFIRFCLQYHRLADAIQQITLDDKMICTWYGDGCIWGDVDKKMKLIQILYDLNEINFDILDTKCNYELDTSWPTIMANKKKQYKSSDTQSISNMSLASRNRTYSQSSLSSVYTDNNENLSGSTPLEMDDDIFSKLSVNFNKVDLQNSTQQSNMMMMLEESLTVDQNNSLPHEQEEPNHDLMRIMSESLAEQQHELNEMKSKYDDVNIENVNLKRKNDELLAQNSRLEAEMCEIDGYKRKYANLEENSHQISVLLKATQNDNDLLRQELSALKFELSAKTIHEENLAKETSSQSELLATLKEMCLQQEITIKQLKKNLDLIKTERKQEIDLQANEIKDLKSMIETKREENFLLSEQLVKLNRFFENERKTNQNLTNELNSVKIDLELKVNLSNQLEMDNNEIKKRLVKLIKEKADLWQKADSLEYENLLKTNAMWQDDSSVRNCIDCNSQFGLMLRKHHCRVCLKIYCYYCCNNWIEYNNSKIRVCKKCADNQDFLLKHSTPHTPVKPGNIKEENDDEDGDDDDDDPDINFEVRSEKLSSVPNDDTPTGDTARSSGISKKRLSLSIKKAKTKPKTNSLLSHSYPQLRLDSNNEPQFYVPENSIDDLDTFAIVSNEEIRKTLKQ